MSAQHNNLTNALLEILRPEIERIAEEKAIEIMRAAVGLKTVEDFHSDELITAVEVARLLGRDVSSAILARRSARAILNLVYSGHIPASVIVRPSPHRVMFKRAAIVRWIDEGGCLALTTAT